MHPTSKQSAPGVVGALPMLLPISEPMSLNAIWWPCTLPPPLPPALREPEVAAARGASRGAPRGASVLKRGGPRGAGRLRRRANIGAGVGERNLMPLHVLRSGQRLRGAAGHARRRARLLAARQVAHARDVEAGPAGANVKAGAAGAADLKAGAAGGRREGAQVAARAASARHAGRRLRAARSPSRPASMEAPLFDLRLRHAVAMQGRPFRQSPVGLINTGHTHATRTHDRSLERKNRFRRFGQPDAPGREPISEPRSEPAPSSEPRS